MKTVFIAHPIGGNVRENAEKVVNICKAVHSKEIIPIAPYLVSIQYLNDEVEEDRLLGIEANLEAFNRHYIDELWLFGDRISPGMTEEIKLAAKLSIPIIPKTDETKKILPSVVATISNNEI